MDGRKLGREPALRVEHEQGSRHLQRSGADGDLHLANGMPACAEELGEGCGPTLRGVERGGGAEDRPARRAVDGADKREGELDYDGAGRDNEHHPPSSWDLIPPLASAHRPRRGASRGDG